MDGQRGADVGGAGGGATACLRAGLAPLSRWRGMRGKFRGGAGKVGRVGLGFERVGGAFFNVRWMGCDSFRRDISGLRKRSGGGG